MKKRAYDKLPPSTKRTYDTLSAYLFKLMGEKPFEKISIIDICTSAGVPRATFYNHFEDKYDLLHYALKRLLKKITSDLNSNTNQKYYPLKTADDILSFISANKKTVRKIVSANRNGIIFYEIKNIVFEYLYEALTIKESVEKKYTPNKDIIAEFYANGIVFSAKTWIEQGMTTPKEAIIKVLEATLTAIQ